MLHPRFFAKPPEISQDAHYRVLRYAQVSDWTLVQWRVDLGEESQFGEDLYLGFEKKASTGGQLALYVASENSDQSVIDVQSPFSLVNPGIGAYGLPVQVAIALRQGKNQFDINLQR